MIYATNKGFVIEWETFYVVNVYVIINGKNTGYTEISKMFLRTKLGLESAKAELNKYDN